MDYKPFYRFVKEFLGGKISRGLFVLEWDVEQNRQGITLTVRNRGGKR
jgi:hypothetical protein